MGIKTEIELCSKMITERMDCFAARLKTVTAMLIIILVRRIYVCGTYLCHTAGYARVSRCGHVHSGAGGKRKENDGSGKFNIYTAVFVWSISLIGFTLHAI